MLHSETDEPLLLRRPDSSRQPNGTSAPRSYTALRPLGGPRGGAVADLRSFARCPAVLPHNVLWLAIVNCLVFLLAFKLGGYYYSPGQRSGDDSLCPLAAQQQLLLHSQAIDGSAGLSRHQFSSHNCLAGHSFVAGGEASIGADALAHSRMCHFRSVCLDREGELLFYSDPTIPPEPIKVDRTIHTDFPAHLVNLRRYVVGLEQAFYSARVVRSAIPTDAVWSSARVHAVYHQFCPENFGHVLGDDLYPVWQQLRRFGINSSRHELQILACEHCSYSGRDEQSRHRACNNTHTLFRTISQRPWMQIDQFIAAQLNGSSDTASASLSDSGVVCMEQLVMGHGLSGMYWQGRDWPLFVDWMVEQFPASVRGTRPQQLSILVTRKVNRRKIINFDEMIDYLRSLFDMPVDVWEPDQLSFHEQIRTVRQYAVLVTPCGGISFVSPFMAAGSSVVYIDWFDPRWNATTAMEEYLWQYDPRLSRFHYHIHRDDIRGLDQQAMQRDRIAANTDERLLWRNYALLYVQPERMAYFVMHALRRAARQLQLNDTVEYTRLMEQTQHFSQIALHSTEREQREKENLTQAAAPTVDDPVDVGPDRDAPSTVSEVELYSVAQLIRDTNALGGNDSSSVAMCGPHVYYWTPGAGRDNFGDMLGVVLVRLITHFDPRVRLSRNWATHPKLTAIGSIADKVSGDDWVWSSGVHPSAHTALTRHSNSSLSYPERYRSIHVAALRGPLSRQFLLDATQHSLHVPEVYGDGALLLPLYFSRLRSEALEQQSQQLVLIIPHFPRLFGRQEEAGQRG